jgi:hypothetical protein
LAEPRLEIEKRVDEQNERLDRIELAVGTMAQWLVQAQTGFGAQDAAGIEKILRGEKSEETNDERVESSSDHPLPE